VASIPKKKGHSEYWWGKLDEGEHGRRLGIKYKNILNEL
jgi:hypothetical protein